MRAVQKDASRQFRVLKRQQDKNAFLGRRCLNLVGSVAHIHCGGNQQKEARAISLDRKSTRLNSSHLVISYAVFCLKKKTNQKEYIKSRIHTITITIHQHAIRITP